MLREKANSDMLLKNDDILATCEKENHHKPMTFNYNFTISSNFMVQKYWPLDLSHRLFCLILIERFMLG